jgi:hypothetical protein
MNAKTNEFLNGLFKRGEIEPFFKDASTFQDFMLQKALQ